MAISPLFPQLWSARITYFATQFSAFLPNATRAWEGEAIYGNTIKIPTVDRDVTLKTYSRTADLDAPEDIDATTQDLTIDQERYFNFALEDLDARQSRISGSQLIDMKSMGAGLKIASTIDDYMCSLLQSIKSADFLKDFGAADFDINFTADLKELLTLNNLVRAGWVIVTTPEIVKKVENGVLDGTYGDALASAQFRSGFSGDPAAATNGLAAVVNGMPFYASNNPRLRVKNDGTAATATNRQDESYALAYNPLDVALVQQVNSVEAYRQEKRFGTGVKGLTNYGGKVLNQGRIVRFRFRDTASGG